MAINLQQISIKKLSAIVNLGTLNEDTPLVQKVELMQLQYEAMRIGFIFTEAALLAMEGNSTLMKEVLSELSKLVGADKVWKPMYPNFPQQVFEMSEYELYFNAILHYWTAGTWLPEYKSEKVELLNFTDVKFKQIDAVSLDGFMGLFRSLLGSNGSLTPYDLEVVTYFLNNYEQQTLVKYAPDNIPFKETLCLCVSEAYKLGMYDLASKAMKTTTDVLRVACGLSGGDVTLINQTKFKLSNKQRRFIVEALESVISEEDVARYEQRWVRLFHCLHIGSFKKAVKCNAIAAKAREGKAKTYASLIEAALLKNDVKEVIHLLSNRPGDFARRLDHVLRTTDQPHGVVEAFINIADKVDTRVLVQVKNHFNYRMGKSKRIVFPKGNVAKAIVLREEVKELDFSIVNMLYTGIQSVLSERFAQLEPMGNVYIDPILKKCPVQMSMRNASDGLKVLQRGTRIPLGNDKDVLRFFIHWIGHDLDLSAVFLKKDLTLHSTIAYYNLKTTDGVKSAHSGDITYAPGPHGACEFIDIDLSTITDPDIRYISMDVRVFSGLGFAAQHANAGWMLRDEVSAQRGEIFDAKTVEQRIALETNSHQGTIAVFDIKERVAIWLDVTGQIGESYGGNNVASNKASVVEMVEAAISMKSPTVYDLLETHGLNRGTIVETPEEADVVFGEEMIYKYETILSEYLT